MKIRVLIADDHRLMREGLTALLGSSRSIEVVGEAENGRQALESVPVLQPDIVIMDVSMPDLNGVEATRLIREAHPDVRVIALSIHADRRFVLRMFAAGASGYLLKDCAFEELTRAVRAVSGGQAYVSPAIAGLLIGDYVRNLLGGRAPADPSEPPLSPREREVLQLLAEGRSTKEMAAHLGVSIKTVETHRRQIMEKLGIRSVAGLTKFAIREGITSL